MADSKELQELFHSCMPLFIALGDEVRLNIIEALCIASQNGHTEGLNVNEITRQTNLSLNLNKDTNPVVGSTLDVYAAGT